MEKEPRNSTYFNKAFGTVNKKHYYKAQEAMRNGEDVSLVSERIASKSTTIRGIEIKEWGLDLDSLLVDTETNYYARKIL